MAVDEERDVGCAVRIERRLRKHAVNVDCISCNSWLSAQKCLHEPRARRTGEVKVCSMWYLLDDVGRYWVICGIMPRSVVSLGRVWLGPA